MNRQTLGFIVRRANEHIPIEVTPAQCFGIAQFWRVSAWYDMTAVKANEAFEVIKPRKVLLVPPTGNEFIEFLPLEQFSGYGIDDGWFADHDTAAAAERSPA